MKVTEYLCARHSFKIISVWDVGLSLAFQEVHIKPFQMNCELADTLCFMLNKLENKNDNDMKCLLSSAKKISNRLLVFAKFQSKSMLQVSLVCSTFTFHAIAMMLPKTFRTFSICMCAKTKTILYYLYYYKKRCNKSTWEKV